MTNQAPFDSGVDLVHLATKDFEAAVHFYGTVLGLPCTSRYGEHPGAEFETGNLTLQVMESEAFGLEFHRAPNPIALHVDDVEAARTELESQGVAFRADTIDSGVCTWRSSRIRTGMRSCSTTATHRGLRQLLSARRQSCPPAGPYGTYSVTRRATIVTRKTWREALRSRSAPG
jgi:catechol 2,3-dioxygenase-like lactoylglutathione lyase family enzyme